MGVFLFIILTIAVFFFLLMLMPKILYFATLIYHVFVPKEKKKIKGKSKDYKLSDLKEMSKRRII